MLDPQALPLFRNLIVQCGAVNSLEHCFVVHSWCRSEWGLNILLPPCAVELYCFCCHQRPSWQQDGGVGGREAGIARLFQLMHHICFLPCIKHPFSTSVAALLLSSTILPPFPYLSTLLLTLLASGEYFHPLLPHSANAPALHILCMLASVS